MASLIKRGRLYSCRMHIGGKGVWRSLGAANREKTEKLVIALESAAKGRQWVRRQFDELTAKAEREVHPDEASILCESLLGNRKRTEGDGAAPRG